MQSYIFDFNGTLFLDTPLHREAWKRFMAKLDIALSDEDFERYIIGPSNEFIFRHFLGQHLSNEEIDRLSEGKEAVYRGIVLADPALQSLTPGAFEMLDMLKARDIPCAVATASIRSNVDFYMNDLGLSRWFDYDHMFYMTGDFPGKPDPAIYLETMRRLGYVPEDTTVVEDSMTGIRAASAAGVGRIIAIDTTMGREALEQVDGVDGIIHDFYGFERFLSD